MSRIRIVLGLLAGALIVLSSAAHSLLGWHSLKQELLKTQAPPDLMLALALAWHFMGAAMLAIGCIVIATFLAARKSAPPSLLPVKIISSLYVLFGVSALLVSNFDGFFLTFLVPGTLLGWAAWRGESSA